MTTQNDSQALGSLHGTVDNGQDSTPLATVTLRGDGDPQVQYTNAEGRFRFSGLQPGNYRLTAALEGLGSSGNLNVVIDAGRDTRIEVQLHPTT